MGIGTYYSVIDVYVYVYVYVVVVVCCMWVVVMGSSNIVGSIHGQYNEQ